MSTSFADHKHSAHGRRTQWKDASPVSRTVRSLKSLLLPTMVLSIGSSLYLMFASTTISTEFARIDNVATERIRPYRRQPMDSTETLLSRITTLATDVMEDLRSPLAQPLARCFENDEISEENGGHEHSNLWQTCVPVFMGKQQLGARPYGNEPRDKNGIEYSFCRGDYHSRFKKEGICPNQQNENLAQAMLPFDLYRFGRVEQPEELWFLKNYTRKGCFGVDGTSHSSVCFPEDRIEGFTSDCFYAPDRPKTILCLPKWIGLGLHKSGSTALFHFIKTNFPTYRYRKERRFFNPSRGETVFNSSNAMNCRFPNMKCYLGDGAHAGPKGIYGDLTVPLTFYIHAPLFIEQVQPQAKFIITLRDPIELLWSRFHFNKMKTTDVRKSIIMGLEWFMSCQESSEWRKQTGLRWDPACSFKSAAAEEIAIEVNNTDLSTGLRLVRDGLFADTMHLWLARFNHSQFLFVPNSQLRNASDVDDLTNSISTFLNVPPYEKHPDFVTRNIATKYASLPEKYPDVAKLLETFFRPQKLWLSQLSGIPEDTVF